MLPILRSFLEGIVMTVFEAGSENERKSWWLVFQLCTIAIAAAGTTAIVKLSDVWPNYIYISDTFFLTLAIIAIALRIRPIGSAVTSKLNAIAAFLYERKAFSSDTVAEAPKFALIRIAFGLFMAHRAWIILFYFTSADWHHPLVTTAAIANFAAACLIATGLFTQFAFAFLILIQWQPFEIVLSVSTLGNDIAAMFSLLLMFANSGAHLSLDRLLINRDGSIGRLIALFYYRSGLPGNNTLQIVKLCSIFAYWCVCLYSLMQHLSEHAWMTGTAGPHLLTSQFMSQHSGLFAEFFSLGSWAIWLGRLSLWAMLPWYALLFPFVLLGGAFRTYVIIWAVLFFALSMFILQLGWLSHFEFLFFLALFWEKRFIAGSKSLHIAYDDRCNLCDRTVQFIKYADIFQRIELRPLSKNIDWLVSLGISQDDAMKDLYGVDVQNGNRTASGYDFYILLARSVLLLWPFYPLLVLGRWLRIGPVIYRFVAERRVRAFGVCEIPSVKKSYAFASSNQAPSVSIQRNDPIAIVSLHVLLLAFFYIITIPAPFLGWSGVHFPAQLAMTKLRLVAAAHIYGIAPINVFNRTDLRMSEHWFTISIVAPDQSEKLLPIFSEDGERLSMHESDRVYFGNTLQFARNSIGSEGCLFEKYRSSIEYLSSNYRASHPGVALIFRQYYRPLAQDDAILAGVFSRPPKSVTCTVRF
jgi:predicted DCC family thiol-disulfide oxidoreductase YuxK